MWKNRKLPDMADGRGFQSIGGLVPTLGKSYQTRPVSRIEARLLLPLDQEPVTVYQHSVLCQTCLPYRDPGEATIWLRTNGNIRMQLEAGQILDPKTRDFVGVGLPWGPKARLVLYHLNAEAMKQQSRVITVEDSLTAFVGRTLGLDTNGRNLRAIKGQLIRLSAADLRVGALYAGGAVTIKSTIIDGLELWAPRDPNQKTLWPSVIRFSQSYFESLMEHAVPLNEQAVGRLSHNAMALDLYTWLAQRLHRIDPKRGHAFVPWVSLKEQFGPGYGRMDNFKRVFRTTLKQVAVIYREAKFAVTDKGMELSHSLPPVLKRSRQLH